MINLIVFIFGSLVGSFLNVCIHRMPQEKSVIWPRSYCPQCKRPILWYDNIPLISYLFLWGRCRICKEKISFMYFVVELLTAVMFLAFYDYFGPTFNFFFYIILISGLIVASFVDISHRIIPDEISMGGIILGLVFCLIRGIALRPLAFSPKPLIDSFLGVVIGGGIIYLSGLIFDLVYFKLLKKPPIQGETSSMGGGDVKLLAMIGAFLGWQAALLTFFLAPFFGVVAGIINLLVKKDHTIPYGPFLALAALVNIFWAQRIIGLIFVR